jgi:polyisoprenyl-phosphate glycosyltransferase
MKSITVVVPVYNEEHVIEKFYTALKAELAQLMHYSHTILFVVDGGRDKTASILRDIAAHDSSVHALVFSRNFGHQMALLAGLDHTTSDAVITMDGDLQHPPHLIAQLLHEFENGNDVVHAVRKDTEDIGLRRKLASIIFYRFMNVISDTPITEGAADFRLLSRRVVEIIHTRIRERNLFIRGIVNWIGFQQSTVSFVAAKRAAGTSKYSLLKLIRFAFSGSVSFSRKPLRVASFVGLLFALGGFFFTAMTLVEYWMGDPFPSGWASVVILLSVFGGLQLVFLGIVGEYIGAIFDEVKARPHYLIDEVING